MHQRAVGLNRRSSGAWQLASGALLVILSLVVAATLLLRSAQAAGTLVGAWAFEEGTGGSGATTADSSGNGYAGTLVGAPTWSTSVPDSPSASTYALGFGGSNAVRVANAAAFEATTLTLSGWVKPTWTTSAINYNPTLFSMRSGTGTHWSIHVRRDYSGVDFWNGSANSTFAVTITPNEWVHVAVVFESGTSWRLYLDGTQIGAQTHSMGSASGQPFNIGYNGSGEYFIGLMDEVRFFSGALSASEIAALANSGYNCTLLVENANDSGAGSLRQAIADICAGGRITFAADATIYLDSTLALTREVTIDGVGHTITLSGDSGNDGSRNLQIVDVTATAAVTLTDLILVDGFGGEGGAIELTGGNLTVIDSSFMRNGAGASGGAIFGMGGTLSVSGSTFSSNTATLNGGAIWAESGTATITNSTFSGNSAASGGAIRTFNQPLTLDHTTFSDNTATSGGALFLYGPTTIGNSLIANSMGGSECVIQNFAISFTASLIEDGSCDAPLSGDPRLASLGDYGGATQTFALLRDSPAIDAGNPSFCAATDQRGLARSQGATCDIGAFESRYALVASSGSGQITAQATAFSLPLAVQLASNEAAVPINGSSVVTFTAPSSGASLATPVFTATLDSVGSASVSVTANSIVGSYEVVASSSGVSAPARFTLTNCGSGVMVTSAANSGSGSLREAIANLCAGGTITFAQDYTIPLTSHLELTRGVTIDGGSHAITISGALDTASTRDGGVFWVNAPGPVTLSRLTIISGTARLGGAIYNATTLTVEESTISGSRTLGTSAHGSGIYNNGALTVTGTLIANNSATGRAGGLYNNTGDTIVVIDSTLAGNRAIGAGGGMYINSGTATIAGSTFSANSTSSFGGGIELNAGSLTVSGSTFSGNTAPEGAGIDMTGGTLTINNSTVANNTATALGGGVYVYGAASVTRITNSTLSGNSAPIAGGLNNRGTLHLKNTLIANSQAGADCVSTGTIATNVTNLIEDGSCTAALSGDPLLADLGDYAGATQTFALLPGSPAIDAGTAADCLSTDQRGVARPQGSDCDIGAFESQGFRLTITGGTPQSTRINTAFPNPLALRFEASNSSEPIGANRVITFTAPLAGASLATAIVTGTTNASGALAVPVTANGVIGSYVVTATIPGITSPVSFTLSNTNTYDLSVSAAGSGQGSVTSNPSGITCATHPPVGSCLGSFSAGTVVSLTAAPSPSSTFTGWSGACSGTAVSCEITLDQARAVTATFTLNQYVLGVELAGNGAGAVTSTPAGISCAAGGPVGGCSVSFDHGTMITLTATPAAGSTFAGWSGACSGAGSCAVALDAAKHVTATFEPATHTLFLPRMVR